MSSDFAPISDRHGPFAGRQPPLLSFRVESAEAVPFAAAPLISLALRITSNQPVHTVAVRCQVQIEVGRRTYTSDEQAALADLFGPLSRWTDTLRPLLWTNASVLAPAFSEWVVVKLQLPCSYDLCLAITQYFHALSAGEVPLQLLFSGTTFYAGSGGSLAVVPISWSHEARFRLPVALVQQVLDLYYPGSARLVVPRELIDKLRVFKQQHRLATWHQALARLLATAVPPEVP